MKIVFLSLPAHGRCSFPAYSAAVRHTASASAGIESGGFSVYIYSQIWRTDYEQGYIDCGCGKRDYSGTDRLRTSDFYHEKRPDIRALVRGYARRGCRTWLFCRQSQNQKVNLRCLYGAFSIALMMICLPVNHLFFCVFSEFNHPLPERGRIHIQSLKKQISLQIHGRQENTDEITYSIVNRLHPARP